jgi:hypothetical protein
MVKTEVTITRLKGVRYFNRYRSTMSSIKTECFNVDRAYHIYHNLIPFATQFRNEQAKDENIKATRSQFAKYLEAMDPDPLNSVNVSYAKHTNKLQIGRLFAQGPSLQGMIREIRDTILTFVPFHPT